MFAQSSDGSRLRFWIIAQLHFFPLPITFTQHCGDSKKPDIIFHCQVSGESPSQSHLSHVCDSCLMINGINILFFCLVGVKCTHRYNTVMKLILCGVKSSCCISLLHIAVVENDNWFICYLWYKQKQQLTGEAKNILWLLSQGKSPQTLSIC